MIVRDLLEEKGKAIFTISPEHSLADCIKVLNDKRVGSLIVLDLNQEVRGIISERDILHATHDAREQMFELRVKDTMTPREKLIVASEDDRITDVMEIMTQSRIRHLPIMEDEVIVGIISIGDVVKGLLHEAVEENKHMHSYIYGRYAVNADSKE